jgi:Lon protease-like protein
MKLNRVYGSPAEMPAEIPLFPLEGALLLPRRPIQLTVFEPRYLEMLDESLGGERLIAIIQPTEPETSGNPPALYPTGCAGRIVQFAEVGDGRCLLTLMGISRFRLGGEKATIKPYRSAFVDYTPFAEDFREGSGQDGVDRDSLLATLRRYAEAHDIKIAWNDVKGASNEALVNGLCMMSPCGPREKQALLEAADLKSRADMLVAITTIDLARSADSNSHLH